MQFTHSFTILNLQWDHVDSYELLASYEFSILSERSSLPRDVAGVESAHSIIDAALYEKREREIRKTEGKRRDDKREIERGW